MTITRENFNTTAGLVYTTDQDFFDALDGAELYVDKDKTFLTAITVKGRLNFVNGAKFIHGTNALHITNGIVDTMKQIFSGTGLVTIDNNVVPFVRPEWFGLEYGSDCTYAIQKAIDSITTGTVLLEAPLYVVNGPLTVPAGVKIVDCSSNSLVYKLINLDLQTNQRLMVSGGIGNGKTLITPIGGIASLFYNAGDYQVNKGHLVSVSNTDAYGFYKSEMGSMTVFGVAYEIIPVETWGLIVHHGSVDVLFNSLGATIGHYFRISLSSDTNGDNNGLACSVAMGLVDLYRSKGYVMSGVNSEGLYRCFIR